MNNKMRIASFTLCASISVVLAACGNSAPSGSDAKAALASSIGDCSYITITDFKKTNGIQGDDANSYRVEIAYTLKLDTDHDDLPDTLKQFAENRDKLKSVQNDASQRYEKIDSDAHVYVDAHEHDPGFDPNTYSNMLGQREANDQQYQDDEKQINQLYAALAVNPADVFLTKVRNACPNVPDNILHDFFHRNWLNEQLSDGITQGYTATIPMIKTDNGWQLAR